MSWKNEKHRHALSSRGISNKADLIRQKEELERQITKIERQEWLEGIHQKIKEWMDGEIDVREERIYDDIPLTDDEWGKLLSTIDLDQFVRIFYDGDYNYMIEDNPMIMNFFMEHWTADNISDYNESTFDILREKYPERFKDADDDEIWEDLGESEVEEVILNYVYDNDQYYMFEDNPGIYDELQDWWMKHHPYEEEAREYMNSMQARFAKLPPITKDDIDQIYNEAIYHYGITSEEEAKYDIYNKVMRSF